MSSPWSTIAVPETKKIEEIISEELKENLRRKITECASTCPIVKRKCDMTDEELAKILREEYDIIYSEEDVHSSEDCEYNSDSDLEDPEDPYYEYFNPILEKFDPVPLYNCKRRQDDANSRTCKHFSVGVAPRTKQIVDDMIEKKVFDKVYSVTKREKTSVLFVRKCLESSDTCTQRKYVVKVFKMIIPRSRELKLEKKNYNRLYKILEERLHEKVQKEALYLERLKKAGIPCPEVIALERHVIVLSLIGGKKPAPTLKNSNLDAKQYQAAFYQVREYMKKMYRECNLIHANLTEENILWHKDCCYVTSLSSAVEPDEDDALMLLANDCLNVSKFFTKMGVPYTDPGWSLAVYITGNWDMMYYCVGE